jgi:hypothetical protein
MPACLCEGEQRPYWNEQCFIRNIYTCTEINALILSYVGNGDNMEDVAGS